MGKIKTFVGRKKRFFCNHCRSQTRHTCRSNYFCHEGNAVMEEDGITFHGIDCYRVWECNGCEEIQLEQSWGLLKCYDRKGRSWYDDGGEYEFACYPDRTEDSVPVRHYRNLPDAVANAYYESVFAHHRSLYLLCALGVRNLIEAICEDRHIPGDTLRERIDGLESHLPASTAKKLHSLRFIGNRAAHEFREPPPSVLRLALEVCEDILNFVYEMNHRASELEKAVMERKEGPNSR